MSIKTTRRHAFLAMIFGVVLLSGLLVSTSAMAQSFQLDDLVGMWAIKSSGCTNSSFSYIVYQATTAPASLTLRYVRVDMTDTICIKTPSEVLYQLTVTDRSLSGTVTMDTTASWSIMGCTGEKRTFPVTGRISPDGNTITIVHNHDWPTYQPCGWGNPSESVRQLDRYH